MLNDNILMCAKAEISPVLENNNLSYTSQNHSDVTILKHFANIMADEYNCRILTS